MVVGSVQEKEQDRAMAGTGNGTGRIEGDYTLPSGGVLRPPAGSAGVEITGLLSSQGAGSVEGNLRCREIRIEGGTLMVHGSVEVSGTIALRRGRLEVDGNLKADSLDGDRGVIVRGNLECRDVDIGGVVEISGTTKGDEFEVGGSAELRGAVDLTSLEVGGRVLVGGGTVRRSIEVGGKFESTAPLTFGSLEIGGVGRLRASAQGETLEAGGMIDCDSDLVATKETEVGGKIRVVGQLRSGRIEVGGLLSAGSVSGEDVEVGGEAEVAGAFTAHRLEVGGRLSAERVVVSDRLEVGDEIRTKAGAKADSIRIGDRGVVRGPSVAREIAVGDRGEVEDVWAGTLRLGSRSRARNVYAEELEVASRVEIQGETQFVRRLRGDDARFGQPPRQVSQLPPPPL